MQSYKTNLSSWLEERKQLLTLYYRVLDLYPFKIEFVTEDAAALRMFFIKLTDYISSSHFEVFQNISREMLIDGEDGAEFTPRLLDKIMATSTTLLSIANINKNVKNISKDNLGNIGETLATRLDLEDKLLKLYFEYKFEAA